MFTRFTSIISRFTNNSVLWYCILIALPITAMFILFSGCGSLGSVIGTGGWSENYALMDGVTATAPEMIDGDINTSAPTAFPEGGTASTYGTSPPSEAIVTLPQKMSISRIVINAPTLKTFDILSDKGDGDWETIKEIKAVQQHPIEVRVSTRTDKIRIRVKATTNDAAVGRRERARSWGGRSTGRSRAPADIKEIELYGYATGAVSAAAETKQAEEDELDNLLK